MTSDFMEIYYFANKTKKVICFYLQPYFTVIKKFNSYSFYIFFLYGVNAASGKFVKGFKRFSCKRYFSMSGYLMTGFGKAPSSKFLCKVIQVQLLYLDGEILEFTYQGHFNNIF